MPAHQLIANSIKGSQMSKGESEFQIENTPQEQ